MVTQINQNGLVLQLGQGLSYWVLADLYTFTGATGRGCRYHARNYYKTYQCAHDYDW